MTSRPTAFIPEPQGESDGQATPLTALPDGIWHVVNRMPVTAGRPGLFLDRDGVLVEEVGYLHRAVDVRLLPGAVELVRIANLAEIAVIVVTNQAGIGRAFYGWEDFEAVRNRIDDLLQREGVFLNAVYACPFHPAALEEYRHVAHPGRKPGPGMLLRAGSDLEIDLANSWMAGDTFEDIEAGRMAGLAGAVHVRSGHGVRDRERVVAGAWEGLEVRFAEDAHEVIARIPLFGGPPG
jgi:D-glycero-D-manno-heptose 1,7-bisphosphate phosphatase